MSIIFVTKIYLVIQLNFITLNKKNEIVLKLYLKSFHFLINPIMINLFKVFCFLAKL